MNNKQLLLIILFTGLIVSCGPSKEDYDQLVTISTSIGDIKLIMFDDTPKHKASFIELASEGAYDSTRFHRVMKEFMIQGGDVSTNEDFEKESRRLIPAEFLPNHYHIKGMLAAARQNTSQNPFKNSTTQFYIVHGKTFTEEELKTDMNKLNGSLSKFLYDGQHQELIDELKGLQDEGLGDELQKRVLELRPEMEKALEMDFVNHNISEEQIKAYSTLGGAPHLDGEYTVFGQVVEGLNVVDKIAIVEVDSVNNPLEPVYMFLSVEEILKDSVTAKYGIVYPEPSSN